MVAVTADSGALRGAVTPGPVVAGNRGAGVRCRFRAGFFFSYVLKKYYFPSHFRSRNSSRPVYTVLYNTMFYAARLQNGVAYISVFCMRARGVS